MLVAKISTKNNCLQMSHRFGSSVCDAHPGNNARTVRMALTTQHADC
jgi:hypothetical protein